VKLLRWVAPVQAPARVQPRVCVPLPPAQCGWDGLAVRHRVRGARRPVSRGFGGKDPSSGVSRSECRCLCE